MSRPLAACLALSSAALLAAPAQAAPSQALLAAQTAWRSAIEHLAVPGEGCFAAAFPNRAWRQVRCVEAPHRAYLPRSASRATGDTVGNGHDYAAVTSTLTTVAVGAFPKVTGLTSESDEGFANDYSLQLNSGFMNTAACNSGASGCLSWQQFIYSSGEQAVFMQYWLIGYNTNGSTCPTSQWYSDGQGDCYINSNAVGAPTIAATELSGLKIRGSAKLHGNDTVTLTTPTKAYTVSGKDTVVDLATAWNQSEFNVIGDGGGTEADFNTGTSIKVSITLQDGAAVAPVCAANAGTTGETNNLNLSGPCHAVANKTPYVYFIEKN